MTGAQFLSLLRLYTRSNTTTLPNADIVTFFNAAQDWMAQKIESVNEGFFSMDQTTDLVANERVYTLPVGMMNRIEKVYVKFPTWDRWRTATEAQLSMQPWPVDEDTITRMYSDDNPQFFLRRNSIILLTHSAIPAGADGLNLWAKVYPSPISTTTLSSNADLSVSPTSTGVGVPRQIHELICRRISTEWKQTQDRPIPLTEKEQKFDQDFKEALDAIKGQNIQRSVVVQMDGYDPELGVGLWRPFLPFQN